MLDLGPVNPEWILLNLTFWPCFLPVPNTTRWTSGFPGSSSKHGHFVIHEKVTNSCHWDFTYTEMCRFWSVFHAYLLRFLSISDEWRIWRGFLGVITANLGLGCISKCWLLLTKAHNNWRSTLLHQLLEIYKGLFLFHFSLIQQQSCFIYTSSEPLAIPITALMNEMRVSISPDKFRSKFPDFPQLWVERLMIAVFMRSVSAGVTKKPPYQLPGICKASDNVE